MNGMTAYKSPSARLIKTGVRMDFAAARRQMVDCQILPNRVVDERVIGVISDMPREAFVPEPKRGIAYVDEAISIGDGRYVMEPMVIARLLQALELKPTDVALSIGCGSGYAVGILARIVDTVVAVEPDGGMASRATQTLFDFGVDNFAVIDAPLAGGYAEQAPYDVIFFDGAVPSVPDSIADQLADGGRLAAIVTGADGIGRGVLMTNFGGVRSSREIFDAGTPYLPGFESESTFVF